MTILHKSQLILNVLIVPSRFKIAHGGSFDKVIPRDRLANSRSHVIDDSPHHHESAALKHSSSRSTNISRPPPPEYPRNKARPPATHRMEESGAEWRNHGGDASRCRAPPEPPEPAPLPKKKSKDKIEKVYLKISEQIQKFIRLFS